MSEPKVAPYGSWKSPITSDLIVSDTVSLGQIALDGEDIYWLEGRPAEKGRNVIVRRTPEGRTEEINPPPFNARTTVHEYGGGAYTVSEREVFFSNFADQRLYRTDGKSEPQPITPEKDMRYADGRVDRRRGLIFIVREDHTTGAPEAVNAIVALRLDGPNEEGGRVLVSGHDFYSTPRLSPDGTRLAWLAWNHPNMPWDGTELWVADVGEDGALSNERQVAGGPEESIFQPEWSPDGTLYFVSDRTDWWNIYRLRGGEIEPVCEMEAEFGKPQWAFGMSTYGFRSSHEMICSYSSGGSWRLASLDTQAEELRPVKLPDGYSLASRSDVKVAGDYAVFVWGSPTKPAALVKLHLETGEHEVLRRSTEVSVDPGYISVPEAIEFPTEGGVTAHGFFYRPKNRDYRAPEGERPPLIVESHGGPTSATSALFDLSTQYWTSRGFAVLDVNYGGSTGYGRPYRQRLNGQWGVVDVDDCARGARYLAERGEVDPDRLIIHGGSAGGYTTLNALTFRDVFKAGASHFGISDLMVFVDDTHKFESRYLRTLIGPYPEREELYRERSSIYYTDRLSAPMIFFQGLEDKVVPPNQAEMMVEALRKKGVPVAYLPFEGEQHGFRQAKNIKRSLDAELYFYSRIFGFDLAEPVEPVEIENLR